MSLYLFIYLLTLFYDMKNDYMFWWPSVIKLNLLIEFKIKTKLRIDAEKH